MADNYLEKKMEEHRRGVTSHYRPRLTPSGSRAGILSLPFPPRRVLVSLDNNARNVGLAETIRDALVKKLVQTGSRVAFTHSDRVTGNRMAQAMGACAVTFGDIDVLIKRWEGVDVTIGIDAGEDRPDSMVSIRISPYADERTVTVCLGGCANIDEALRICMMALVPGAEFMLGLSINL